MLVQSTTYVWTTHAGSRKHAIHCLKHHTAGMPTLQLGVMYINNSGVYQQYLVPEANQTNILHLGATTGTPVYIRMYMYL